MNKLEGDCACLEPDSLNELREVAGQQWQTVLMDYLHNGERHEVALVEACQLKDWHSAARVAHNIKGAYGYLGATALVNECVGLLAAVREEAVDDQRLYELTESVLMAFRDVRRCLQKLANE